MGKEETPSSDSDGGMRLGHLSFTIHSCVWSAPWKKGADPKFSGHDEKNVSDRWNLEKDEKWNFGQIKIEKIKRSKFWVNLGKIRKITELAKEIWIDLKKKIYFGEIFRIFFDISRFLNFALESSIEI